MGLFWTNGQHITFEKNEKKKPFFWLKPYLSLNHVCAGYIYINYPLIMDAQKCINIFIFVCSVMQFLFWNSNKTLVKNHPPNNPPKQ